MEWEPDQETLSLIRHLALQNSLQYDGQGKAGSVISRIMGNNADLRQYGKEIAPLVAKEVEKANSIAASEGLDAIKAILEAEAPEMLEKKVHARREGLPELQNLNGRKPILRFAPNPNGPLSFGHSRGLIINSEYAKLYEGSLILRFDDTDTTVKPPMIEAYTRIPKEQEWLCGFPAQKIVIASDRIEEYHSHALEMLEQGFGYVCTCSAEEFKEFRVNMTECPCRNNETDENISKWNLMNKQDGFQPGEAVVRVKTDMGLKNPALRDWPALRIQTNPHPRVGDKWRVWPLLDFQSAVEDHLQGVTHIIRGKDLMDSTRKQLLLYEKFDWTYPETMYWGRVKVHEFGGFSTSQMKSDIAAGKYTGWDDLRLPTIRALKRRGYDAGAIRKFWIEIGLTQKDISVPMSTLNSLNAKAVDADAPRLSFVREPRTVILDITEIELTKVTLPIHPEHPDKGVREWPLGDNPLKVKIASEDFTSREARRLKDFADIGIHHKKAAGVGGWTGEISRTERYGNTPIIHWLPSNMAQPAVLLLEEEGELVAAEGLLEINDYPDGTVVQLERMGFAILEGTETDGTRRLVHLHG